MTPHRACAALLALGLLSTLACGPSARGDDGDGGDGADGAGPDAAPAGPTGEIIAHSADTLYRLDPVTRDLDPIGPIGWPAGHAGDEMTDIAIDSTGQAIALSFTDIYRVDLATAQCTWLASLGGADFNGLSFLPKGVLDPDAEALVASGLDGNLYRLDPFDGSSQLIGSYGGALASSGDIVSVAGFGTVATVTGAGADDALAAIDPATGAATIIGSTGVQGLWGLAFWGDTVFGFSDAGDIVAIDPQTGAATPIATLNTSFWGAGVATDAYVID